MIKKTFVMTDLNGNPVSDDLHGKARVFYWSQRAAVFTCSDRKEAETKALERGLDNSKVVYPVEKEM